MFLIDLLFAFVIALLLAGLIAGIGGWRHPNHPEAAPAVIFLFVVLLAVIWAGGVWSAPYGPAMWGAYVLPFVFIGLVTALIILALAPSTEVMRRDVVPPAEPATETEVAAASALGVFGLFFWLLLIGALIAIILHYAT